MNRDIIARYKKLYSALVSDFVEEAGLGPRAASPGLAPFHSDELRVAVGPAHTCFVRQTSERIEVDNLLAMVEATPTDAMTVMATDRDTGGALWGGLVCTATMQRGGVGAVVDGGIRDLHTIVPLEFPVWARYRSPLDIRRRGEVVHFGRDVTFRGVSVSPGDLVFADANGVVFVPQHAVLDILERCEAHLAKEKTTEQELRRGDRLSEVYARHGAI